MGGSGTREIWSVDNGGAEKVGSLYAGNVTKAVRGHNGTIWAEAPRPVTGGADDKIVRIEPGGARNISKVGDVDLSHVGQTVGITSVGYIDRDGPDGPGHESWDTAYLEAWFGIPMPVAEANGDDYYISSAAPAGDVAAIGGVRNLLDQDVDYRSLSGDPVDGFYDPTEGAPETIQYMYPVLSPDTERLAWVESPGENPWDDELSDFKVVVAASDDGSDELWTAFSYPGESLGYADFDGRFWVGTFGTGTVYEGDFEPQRIVVVDTDDWMLEPFEVCDTPFIASIDDYEDIDDR